jgi:ABC-type glycerol-3-phosphate transport system substrate-binding protein
MSAPDSRLTRRQLVARALGLGVALPVVGGLLAACQPAAAPAPTAAPAAPTTAPKPAATTAPAAAPTAAAAATKPPAAAAPTAAPTAAAAAQPAAQAVSDVSGSLNVWHYFNTQGQKTILTEWQTMFNKAYPKVDVKYVYVEFQELSKKVIAAAGARQGPDVLIYGGSDLVQMYKVGALKSMQPYWDKFADKDKFPDGVITRFDGQIYGVKPYVNLVALWYNQDILDAVGVKPPTTFEEVTPALARIAGAGKNYLPLAMTGRPDNQGDWTSWPWLTGYGFSYDSVDQAAAEQAFTMVGEWSSKGLIAKESVSWGQSETFDRWVTGDTAFMQNGNWNIGNAKENAKFKYGTAEMPKGPKASSIYLGGEPGWIGAFTTIPDVAWGYLQQVYSKEGGLVPLKGAGSIPARSDLATDPAVTGEPLLAAYTTEVKTRGTEYPPKGGAVIAQQLVVAQAWSSVIAGQKSAAQAAKDMVEGIKNAA